MQKPLQDRLLAHASLACSLLLKTILRLRIPIRSHDPSGTNVMRVSGVAPTGQTPLPFKTQGGAGACSGLWDETPLGLGFLPFLHNAMRAPEMAKVRRLGFLICGMAILLASPRAITADVAFLYALDPDLEALRGDAVADVREVNGSVIHSFLLGGHRVTATRMGVGNIETALNTLQLLAFRRPDFVLAVGPAGALHNEATIGSVRRVNQCVGYQRGTFSETGWVLAPESKIICDDMSEIISEDIPVSDLAAGDAFIANDSTREQIHRLSGCDLVDMNSYGLLLACRKLRIPVVVLKVVSDGAGHQASEEFRKFVADYDGKLGILARDSILRMKTPKDSPDAHENIRRLLDSQD